MARVVAVIALLGLGYAALGPRDFRQVRLALRCGKCGEQLVAYRYLLDAPQWIPLRYPGIGGGVHRDFSYATPGVGACRHDWNEVLYAPGAKGIVHRCGAGFVPTVEGAVTTPSTLEAVLATVEDLKRLPILNCAPSGPAGP